MTKCVLITGSSSGFGRALATVALARGHHVAATARNPDTLADLVAQYPGACHALRLDVTKPGEVELAVKDAHQRLGRLDIVINNAGAGLLGPLEDLTTEQILRNLDTNLMGTIRVLRAALPIMRPQRAGRLIAISAAAAIDNYPGFSIYGGAKAAIEAIHESLALELAPHNIKPILVIPGPFRTDFVGRSLTKASTTNPDYAATAGRFAATIQKLNGTQPGDPAKAANAILDAADLDTPPLRLYLGKYAIAKARKKLDKVSADLAASEPLGLPTDFDAKVPVQPS